MNYDVCFYESITCWIRNQHNSVNTKELIKKKIRSKSNWKLKTKLRLNWKRILRSNILLVLRKEIDWSDSLHFRHSWFRCSKSQKQIFNVHKRHVEYQTFASQKSFRFINEMIESKNWRKEITRNLKNLRINKIYDISTVL
jgi:hypothetical protein